MYKPFAKKDNDIERFFSPVEYFQKILNGQESQFPVSVCFFSHQNGVDITIYKEVS